MPWTSLPYVPQPWLTSAGALNRIYQMFRTESIKKKRRSRGTQAGPANT